MSDAPRATSLGAGPGAPAKITPAAGPPPNRPVDVRMVLWMAGLSALWGLNAITIRAVATDMPPLLAAGLRGAVGLGCLVPWGLLRGERLVFRGRLALHGLAVGLLFATEFCLIYGGAALTSGSHVVIYINTSPFFVAIGAHFLLAGDRLFPVRWAGLGLAFAGILVLQSDALWVQQDDLWRGDLLIIAGSAAWAMTTLYIKRFMVQAMNSFELLYVQILVSTPVLLAAAWLLGPAGSATILPRAVAIVVFQGVVIVYFSYLAWMMLLRAYPASAVQSFTFLTPVWGVVLAGLLLDERITAATLASIALVGLGLYLIARPQRAAVG